MSERFAVVMAGGSGKRFLPASRADRPKQFLSLAGSRESLLQATVRRAAAVVGREHVLVVAAARHAELLREQLDLPEDNLLLEPVGRNTAPCIGWAAATVQRRAPDAVLAVLPADPHIGDEAAFVATLQRALNAADGGAIVTVGLHPTRAETGYGYVHVAEAVSEGVHRVERFIEKPDEAGARAMFASGEHLWNGGMFFFGAATIRSEIERQLPELGAFLRRCDAAAAQSRDAERALVEAEYASVPAVSIDYGVMERAEGILVVPGRFEWDDIGSWGAAWALAAKDGTDNALPADAVAIDAEGNYVRAPEGKLVALLGVSDLVVVDTGDALLVMPRERAQDVREIVDALGKRSDPRL